MLMTSAQAAKYLRKLNDDHLELTLREEASSTFLTALGEDPESVRPVYDYTETAQQLSALEEKIRRVKHAINIFNTTHKIEEFDMTVDEILIYIPQLTKKKAKLANLRILLPKTRIATYGRNTIIEYKHINFDPETIRDEYEQTTDTLTRVQTALDVFNNTVQFDVPID